MTDRSRLGASGTAKPAASAADLGHAVAPERTISGHGDFLGLAITPDNQFIAWIPYEEPKAIRIIGVGDGAVVRTIPAYQWATNSVVVTPDGRYLVSGGDDGLVDYQYRLKLWRLSDGALVRTFDIEHTGRIRSLAISPDGQYVASASADTTVRLWRLSDASLVRTYAWHSDEVRTVAFTPDGQRLVSGGDDGQIMVWQVGPSARQASVEKPGAGRRPARLSKPSLVSTIAVGQTVLGQVSGSPYWDAYQLVLTQETTLIITMAATSGDLDCFIQVNDASDIPVDNGWDDDSGDGLDSWLEITLPAGTYYIYAASAYAGQTSTIITTGGYRLSVQTLGLTPGSVSGDITDDAPAIHYSLDVAELTGAIISMTATEGDLDTYLELHDSEGELVADNDDWGDGTDSRIQTILEPGSYTVTATRYSGTGSYELVYTAIPETDLPTLVMDEGSAVRALAVTPDNAYVVSGGGSDTNGYLWSLATGEVVHTLPEHDTGVSSVAASADGRFALTGGGDGSIRVWRISDGGLDRTYEKVHTYDVEWMTIGFGGDVILSGSWGVVKALEASSGRIVSEIGRGHLFSSIIMPDGRTIVTGSADGRIRSWDRRTGALLRTSVQRHDDWVIALAASPDGQYIASAGDFLLDYSARLWKAEDLSLVQMFPHEDYERINSVAVAPGNQMLVTGTDMPAVHVWQVSDADILRTLSGHADAVTDVAVSSDGQRIVSSSKDGTAKMWRVSDGALLQTLTGHAASVTSVAISPDRQWIATSSEDETAKVWNASNGTVARTLSGHAGSVTSVAFSPDGQWVVSGGADKSVRVWSRTDVSLTAALTDVHNDDVRGVGMDASGKYLFSESDDQTTRTWIVDPPMGQSVASHLWTVPQPGLPVRVPIKATLHGATAATLVVTVSPTLLVPGNPFIVRHAFEGTANGQASFGVAGSTITITLSSDEPISLNGDIVVELAFELGPSATPGTNVPITWVTEQTVVTGATPSLTGGTYTVPVPRDVRISTFSPSQSTVGLATEVSVYGANFTGTSAVALVPAVGDAVSIPTFLVPSDGLIRVLVPATVPQGAYQIRITAPKGTAQSAASLVVALPVGDSRRPARVTDLRVDSTTTTSLLVRWTAPADTAGDGSLRAVTGYDLRYTTGAIDSVTFGTLPRVPLPTPKAPGELESVWIAPLVSGRIYFLAVGSVDSAGNRSVLSDLAHGITREDTEPPRVIKQAVTATGDKQITVAVETDEMTRASIKVFQAFGAGGDTLRAVDGTLASVHRLTVTGLVPSTFYGYTLALLDASGNATSTAPRAVQTLAQPDLVPPSFARAPFVANRTDNALTLGWLANEPVTAVVRYGVSTLYSDSVVITDLNTTHIVEITGLAQLTTYHLQVSLYDQSGNGPVTSDDISTRTLREPDLSPPLFVQAPAVLSKGVDRATIMWATDEPATAVVEYGLTEGYGQAAEIRQPETAQTVVLTNLEADTRYHYRVRVRDEAQSETLSDDRVFRTASGPDIQPPVILESPNVIPGTDQVRIRFRTDEPALSTVHFGTSQGSLTRAVGSFQLATDHEVLLSNLSSGTRYYYLVTTFDAAGNAPILRLRSFTTMGAPDTVPPVIVAGPTIPYTGDDRVVFQWRTDEITTGELWYQADGDSVAASVVDPSFDWTHRIALTNLTPGQGYTFAIVMGDAAGNRQVYPDGTTIVTNGGGASKTAPGRITSFTTAVVPDVQSPVILNGPVVVGRAATMLAVAWHTDEVATSIVRYRAKSGAPGRPSQEVFDDQVEIGEYTADHQVTLTNLKPGIAYELQVLSADPANNTPAVSVLATASTTNEVDITPPRITESPSISATDTRAVIRWSTDELSDSEVSYWTEGGAPITVTIGERATEHIVFLTNLKPSTTYHCVVRCADLQDNGPTERGGLIFTTSDDPDIKPPAITAVQVNALGHVSAKIAWQTDEPASSQVEFGETARLGLSVSSGQSVSMHTVAMTNLKPQTTYHYRVTSTDVSGNTVVGDIGTLSTLATADTVPPPIPAGLGADVGDRAARLAWNSVAANDLAGYHVYRTAAAGSEAVVATLIQDTTYVDLGLTNGTAYAYRVQAVDEFGNASPLQTTAVTVTPDANAVPSRPSGISPMARERVSVHPILVGSNAAPSPARPTAALSYSFVIARDSALADVIAASALVPEDPRGTTSWQVRIELVHDSTYYWGVAAHDGLFLGPLSASGAFIADSTMEVPVAVALSELSATGRVGSIVIAWAGASAEDRFRLLRSDAERGPFLSLGDELLTGDSRYTFRDAQVVAGRTYYYRLEQIYPGGSVQRYGPLRAQAIVPTQFALASIAPNPFNPSTWVTFEVARAEPMKLVIYNALGQRVRTLVDAALEPGIHRVVWDGRDDLRREAASGVYFVKMEAPGYEKTAKITMIR